MKIHISIFLALIFFVGCADKSKFNQSDEFWYGEVVKFIGNLDMNRADEAFSSLEAEHINSPLLKTATILLIHSHMNQENYILANHYMDRYNRLFGTKESKEYIEYLRIKSKYLAFKRAKRDQKLILDTLELIDEYLFDYSDSKYIPYIETMKTNLELSKNELNIDIIVLYKKLGKPKAVEFYMNQENMSWVNRKDIKQPEISFIRSIFE